MLYEVLNNCLCTSIPKFTLELTCAVIFSLTINVFHFKTINLIITTH